MNKNSNLSFFLKLLAVFVVVAMLLTGIRAGPFSTQNSTNPTPKITDGVASHNLHYSIFSPKYHLGPPKDGPSFSSSPSFSDPPNPVWDEQEGLTFTQNFASLAYNVSAVSQQDSYGYGPAYLLNGLTTSGYWYQVGLAWNWPDGTGGYSPGFYFAFEVFNDSGVSIFPSDGGGLLPFSGTVNAGDNVLLSLHFQAGNVTMYSYDWNTGAYANASYNAQGSTSFVGLPNTQANSNGFFTGLMTEKYYVDRYFGSQQSAVYKENAQPISSAWMWVDEYDPTNNSMVFSSSTTNPADYSNNPASLQFFSSNGASEASDGFEFLTGGQVAITLSYGSSSGGLSLYTSPTLSYTEDGVDQAVSLNPYPTLYEMDVGSNWEVTPVLQTPNSNVRDAAASAETSGTALKQESIVVSYYAQILVAFGFTVTGGSGYSAPNVNYTSLGLTEVTPAGMSVWVDENSLAFYPKALTGSNNFTRWVASNPSVYASGTNESVTYNYEFSLKVISDLGETIGTGWYDLGSPTTFSAINASFPFPCGAGCRRVFTGWNGTGTGSYNGTNSAASIVLNGPVTEAAIWQYQYYVNFSPFPSDAGLAITSGQWVPSGNQISISASPESGWEFNAWKGSGAGSYSGTSESTSFIVTQPVNETAVFYLGVSITAPAGGSVIYSDGAINGTIGSGTFSTIYIPLGSTLSLRESPSLFFSSGGWQGAFAASQENGTLELTPTGPVSIGGVFVYDYFEIVVVLIVVSAVLVLTFAIYGTRRSRRKKFLAGQSSTVS